MPLNFPQGIKIFHIISLFDMFPSSINCEFGIFKEDNSVSVKFHFIQIM